MKVADSVQSIMAKYAGDPKKERTAANPLEPIRKVLKSIPRDTLARARAYYMTKGEMSDGDMFDLYYYGHEGTRGSSTANLVDELADIVSAEVADNADEKEIKKLISEWATTYGD